MVICNWSHWASPKKRGIRFRRMPLMEKECRLLQPDSVETICGERRIVHRHWIAGAGIGLYWGPDGVGEISFLIHDIGRAEFGSKGQTECNPGKVTGDCLGHSVRKRHRWRA